jgi:hypothetical protein
VNWDVALAGYDRDLRTRGAAERTRRAYGVDLAAFTVWAKSLRLSPGDLRHRDVRRYAASLSADGKASTTVARHLASIRGFYDFLVRTEQIGSNPAELVSSPKKPQKLPQVLTGEQMRMLLQGIPARTPLELRDRAMFAARRSSISTSIPSTSKRTSYGCWARARRRACCRSASPPGGRSNGTSSAAGAHSPTIRASAPCSSARVGDASRTPM